MNTPTSPNKITALIMIALGFSLIFMVAIAYQTYQNGQISTRNGEIISNQTVTITETLTHLDERQASDTRLLNSTNLILQEIHKLVIQNENNGDSIKNNTAVNNKVLNSMLVELKQINNNTKQQN